MVMQLPPASGAVVKNHLISSDGKTAAMDTHSLLSPGMSLFFRTSWVNSLSQAGPVLCHLCHMLVPSYILSHVGPLPTLSHAGPLPTLSHAGPLPTLSHAGPLLYSVTCWSSPYSVTCWSSPCTVTCWSSPYSVTC